jgi:transcriptional/translational regulatory protein YebC/TACO1
LVAKVRRAILQEHNDNAFLLPEVWSYDRTHLMAGHNQWSKVKRIKGAIDAKRGELFSKLAKEIAVAAKLGGPDPDANLRLRSAIALARTRNMPNDNIEIERASKRGDLDDVLNVYSNLELPAAVLERISGRN